MKDSSADNKWLSAIRLLSEKEMARGCKLSNKKKWLVVAKFIN
jgi:hypothetical protein